MRSRLLTFAGAVTVAVFVASIVSTPVAGQAPRTQASTAKYTPKRTADGHPDLQGLYDIATLTPLEADGKTILSDEEAKRAEDQQAARRARAALPRARISGKPAAVARPACSMRRRVINRGLMGYLRAR